MDRVGEINKNSSGNKMRIVKYNNARDIEVLFDEFNYKVTTRYSHFKSGNVSTPFDRTYLNIGYVGIGEYSVSKSIYGKKWESMLQRCYGKQSGNNVVYEKCTVCDEWHNFQNFAKWCEDNYYEIEGDKMCLDKDILIKGNMMYSPDTCVFVPSRINTLFTKGNGSRGDLPIGVDFKKSNSKFRSRCSILDSYGKKISRYLGCFETSNEAFLAYKEFKEKYIKDIAEEYRCKIPVVLYDAMIKYRVDIGD